MATPFSCGEGANALTKSREALEQGTRLEGCEGHSLNRQAARRGSRSSAPRVLLHNRVRVIMVVDELMMVVDELPNTTVQEAKGERYTRVVQREQLGANRTRPDFTATVRGVHTKGLKQIEREGVGSARALGQDIKF